MEEDRIANLADYTFYSYNIKKEVYKNILPVSKTGTDIKVKILKKGLYNINFSHYLPLKAAAKLLINENIIAHSPWTNNGDTMTGCICYVGELNENDIINFNSEYNLLYNEANISIVKIL